MGVACVQTEVSGGHSAVGGLIRENVKLREVNKRQAEKIVQLTCVNYNRPTCRYALYHMHKQEHLHSTNSAKAVALSRCGDDQRTKCPISPKAAAMSPPGV